MNVRINPVNTRSKYNDNHIVGADKKVSSWINVKDDLPSQLTKVLCRKGGDIYVAMRIGDVFLALPKPDKDMRKHLSKPDEWQVIHFPIGLSGKMKFLPEGTNRFLDADEFEMCYPEEFKDMLEGLLEQFND